MNRRSAPIPPAPTAQRPRSRSARRSPGARTRFFGAAALLAIAFCACRSSDAAAENGNEVTAQRMRELIARGALQPIEPRPGDPLTSDATNASEEHLREVSLTTAESEEFDAIAKRLAAQHDLAHRPPAPVPDAATTHAAFASAQEPQPPIVPVATAATPPSSAAPQDPAAAGATGATGATPPVPQAPAVPQELAKPNLPVSPPASSLVGEPPENPYLTFGKRILVYDNGLIMKPYPLRVGMGERLLNLLKTYGNFPLYAEGTQNIQQVRLDLLKDWDQEQVSNLRASDIEETKIQQPFKIADWLVVTASAEKLKEVESFINVFAAGVPQIEIEAKIVEVTTTDVLDLGIKQVNDTTPIFGFPDHTFVQQLGFNLPNTSSAANAVLGLSTVQDGVAFNALLQLLQTYDNVSIISRPKIAVREGGIAKIVNTLKLPSYNVTGITPDGKVAAGLTYEEVGIKLYVVPRVVGTQTVALNIDVEASQQSGTAATFTLGNDQVIANPIISRRAAQTVVYLEPGQAVILGGLVSERTAETENKVPILGSIPLLGYFFKSTLKRKEQANVLFFIRPRILTGSDLNREF